MNRLLLLIVALFISLATKSAFAAYFDVVNKTGSTSGCGDGWGISSAQNISLEITDKEGKVSSHGLMVNQSKQVSTDINNLSVHGDLASDLNNIDISPSSDKNTLEIRVRTKDWKNVLCAYWH